MANPIDYWYQKYLQEKEKKDKLEELGLKAKKGE